MTARSRAASKRPAARRRGASSRVRAHRDAARSMLVEAAELYAGLVGEADQLAQAVELCAAALRRGRQVIFCGNGGSAAQASHLAAELSGRFYKTRAGLRALSLGDNLSAVTAIANDFGYDRVFERQLEALGSEGDVLLGLTTSGASPNMRRVISAARRLGIATIGLTGQRGRAFARRCDLAFVVPSPDTARIQEAHILLGHVICARIEDELFPDSS